MTHIYMLSMTLSSQPQVQRLITKTLPALPPRDTVLLLSYQIGSYIYPSLLFPNPGAQRFPAQARVNQLDSGVFANDVT